VDTAGGIGHYPLVVGSDRLQHEDPELAALVEGWPEADRLGAVRRVVEQVAELTGVADDCRATAGLAGLVARLDEQAWELQERGATEEYERVFARARAANAWFLASGDASLSACCDAIYESLHASTGTGADVVALFYS